MSATKEKLHDVIEKGMKQTAVEWLIEKMQKQIDAGYGFNPKHEEALVNQAKEMEKEQQDEFAIGFAEWCLDENHIILNDGKELLEIYKKENL